MTAAARACIPIAFLVVLFACAALAGYEFPQTCSSNTQCNNLLFTICNDRGRCECLEDYTHMNESGCGKGVRNRCDEGRCDANNSACYNDVCVCRPPYTLVNHNSTFCYKSPERYGDLCNTTSECPNLGIGTECNNGRCLCQDRYGYDWRSATCKEKVDEIGEACNEDQICYLEKDGDNQRVQCVNNVCVCQAKLSKDKQSCSGAATAMASVGALLLLLVGRALS